MNISNLQAYISADRNKVTQHNNNILDNDASILGMTMCRTVNSSTQTCVYMSTALRASNASLIFYLHNNYIFLFAYGHGLYTCIFYKNGGA